MQIVNVCIFTGYKEKYINRKNDFMILRIIKSNNTM